MAVSARINAISIPSKEKSGEKVSVQVSVQRIGPYGVIACAVWVNGVLIDMTPDEYTLNPNVIGVFTGSFTMPNKDAVVTAQSFYYDYDLYGWAFDDEQTATVSLVAELRGTITAKLLWRDNKFYSIPASNVPLGSTVRAHATGRNDESTAQYMKLSWMITDPDKSLVEIYDAVWLPIPPGAEYACRGNLFTLSKKGAYHIDIFLIMNYNNPMDADFYSGDLCTVVEVAPPPVEPRPTEPQFRGLSVVYSKKET